MSPEFARVVALVDAYLAGGEFETLWSAIAGPISIARELGPFAPVEEPLWDELYEIVYMGQSESALDGEAQYGRLGGAELQIRLRRWRSTAV